MANENWVRFQFNLGPHNRTGAQPGFGQVSGYSLGGAEIRGDTTHKPLFCVLQCIFMSTHTHTLEKGHADIELGGAALVLFMALAGSSWDLRARTHTAVVAECL